MYSHVSLTQASLHFYELVCNLYAHRQWLPSICNCAALIHVYKHGIVTCMCVADPWAVRQVRRRPVGPMNCPILRQPPGINGARVWGDTHPNSRSPSIYISGARPERWFNKLRLHKQSTQTQREPLHMRTHSNGCMQPWTNIHVQKPPWQCHLGLAHLGLEDESIRPKVWSPNWRCGVWKKGALRRQWAYNEKCCWAACNTGIIARTCCINFDHPPVALILLTWWKYDTKMLEKHFKNSEYEFVFQYSALPSTTVVKYRRICIKSIWTH